MNSDALALARRLAELDQKETAQQAYTLVLQQSDGSDLIHFWFYFIAHYADFFGPDLFVNPMLPF